MSTIESPETGDCFIWTGTSWMHACVCPETMLWLIKQNEALQSALKEALDGWEGWEGWIEEARGAPVMGDTDRIAELRKLLDAPPQSSV